MLRLTDYMRIKAKQARKSYIFLPHTIATATAFEQAIGGCLPDGKTNLLVNIPARFGKTDMMRAAVEWSIGHLPDSKFILASYGLRLARDSNEAIRSTIREGWYQKLFPACKITDGHDRADDFSTSLKGGVMSVGAGGGITGFAAGQKREGFAGAFIIDDPIKPDDARQSPVIREKVINWYNGTAKSRIEKTGTPFICIMQRTHPDDLSGWILQNEADEWHHIKFEGLLDDGTAAWEEVASAKYLHRLKEVDPFAFWSIYQQVPVNPGGNLIQRHWWHFYEDFDEIVGRCNVIAMFADTAMKEKQHNDASCISVWGFERDKRAYKLDRIKGRWLFPDLVKNVHKYWQSWRDDSRLPTPRCIFIEDKVSGTSLIQTLQKGWTDPDTGIQYQPLPVEPWVAKDFELEKDDKVSRVKACSWDIYGGAVWLPEDAAWIKECLDEWSNFSEDMSHSHDDEVDADTMAMLTWKSMGGGVK